jgi:hypothetical protein
MLVPMLASVNKITTRTEIQQKRNKRFAGYLYSTQRIASHYGTTDAIKLNQLAAM